MPNASDIAARKYDAPIVAPRQRTKHTLNYSKYAKEIFHHLTFHRVCFAEDFPRFLPHRFKTDRLARKHLESIAGEGHIDILEFAERQKPQIYVITDEGFSAAQRHLKHVPNTFPSRKVEIKGQHVLHEALISEVASRRERYLRGQTGFRLLWKERFGFQEIPGFEDVIPDYADAFEGPYGQLIDFVEVLSGEQSITRVRKKLKAWEAWWLSRESREFLEQAFRAWGARTTTPAFRLIIVAHNRSLVSTDFAWEREILGATFDLHPELQRRIWTTTNSAIKEADDINGPIWHNAAHLVRHRAEWRELPKRKRFSYLTNTLAETPTYRLFTFDA